MAKKQNTAQDKQQEQIQEQTPQAQNPAQEYPPMHLDVKVRPTPGKGNLLGYASVNINGCFAVSSIKVVSGENGIFTFMPSYQDNNGGYRDICFPITKEFRQQLNEAVVSEYQQTIEQMQAASIEAQQKAQSHQQAAQQQAATPEMAM